jgi:hypothetical protein
MLEHVVFCFPRRRCCFIGSGSLSGATLLRLLCNKTEEGMIQSNWEAQLPLYCDLSCVPITGYDSPTMWWSRREAVSRCFFRVTSDCIGCNTITDRKPGDYMSFSRPSNAPS